MVPTKVNTHLPVWPNHSPPRHLLKGSENTRSPKHLSGNHSSHFIHGRKPLETGQTSFNRRISKRWPTHKTESSSGIKHMQQCGGTSKASCKVKEASYGSLILHPSVYVARSAHFSCLAVSDSLQPHEPHHARPPCPSPTPGAYSNSCALSRWCHPILPSSVGPVSSRLQALPASRSFPMSPSFASGGTLGKAKPASLVAQWWRSCLPMQKTRDPLLVRQDPTCR